MNFLSIFITKLTIIKWYNEKNEFNYLLTRVSIIYTASFFLMK